MFVQELCIQRLGWDDPLTPELGNRWKEMESELPYLKDIEIQRYVNSVKALPDQKISEKISTLTQYQRITYLKQRLWDLWRRDYLHELQLRSKWLKAESNVRIGQLVLVHEDNLPPQQWQLARITSAIPGSDGRVRVVDLKINNGTLRRPIHKVAPLPVD
ncbi:hypothetical protein ACLKA6_001160 [Drosophila palustris]